MQLTFDETLGGGSVQKEQAPKENSTWFKGRPLSHSSISLYQTCPQKWKFRYIDKIPEAPKSYFSFGKSVHAALEFLFSNLDKEIPSKDEVLATYRSGWMREGYETASQEKWFFQEGERIVSGFYDKHEKEFKSVFKVEFRFDWTLEGVPLTGFIDRIDLLKNDKLAIVDYKTGKPFDKTRVRQDPQLTLYQMACKALLGKEVESVSLYHLNSLTAMAVPAHSKDLEEKVKKTVIATAEGISNLKFDPKPDAGGVCSYCDYRQICPAFKKNSQTTSQPQPTIKEINDLVDRYGKLDERIQTLVKERENLKTKIIPLAKHGGDEGLKGEFYIVRLKSDGREDLALEKTTEDSPS